MDTCRCGSSVRWRARADAMFNANCMQVVDVRRGHGKLVITVETDADTAGCRRCGVVATGHGRRRGEAAGRAVLRDAYADRLAEARLALGRGPTVQLAHGRRSTSRSRRGRC